LNTKDKSKKARRENSSTKASRPSPPQKPLEPYQKLRSSILKFLNDIECAQDMFSLVIPDLRAQDKKTVEEIKKKMSLLKKEAKGGRKNLNRMLSNIRSLASSIYSLNRADMMFRSHALVCIVSRYDYFLSDLLKNAYRKNPERVTGGDRALTYEELLSLDSLDNLVELFISKEIDTFLHETHDKQLKVLDQESKLGIVDNFSELSLFVEMTERRNLFVHAGGIVTKYYLKRCKEVNYPVPSDVKPGTTLSVSEDYFKSAITCIYELGVRLGFALACRLYPDNLEKIHYFLLDSIGFPLLQSERWELARRVFNFALSWPEKYILNDEAKRYYVVNNAIALNHLNRHKDALDLLSKYDWSSQSEKMLLAVSVLQHKWKKAETIMSGMDGDKAFSEDNYRTWPIFKEFRATKEFRRAYKKVYGKRFVVRLSKEDLEKLKKLSEKGNESESSMDLESARNPSPPEI